MGSAKAANTGFGHAEASSSWRGVSWPGFNPIHVAWEHLAVLGGEGFRPLAPWPSLIPVSAKRKDEFNVLLALPTGRSPPPPGESALQPEPLSLSC